MEIVQTGKIKQFFNTHTEMGNKTVRGSQEYQDWSGSVRFRDERGKRIKHNKVEREEQIEVFNMPSDCQVVELGARYGTVSCALSAHLDDPSQHIAVEADSKVWGALQSNRDANRGQFRQVNGVISDEPLCLKQSGYGSSTFTCDAADAIPNYTLEELGADEYTCLVADCEGCTPEFLKKNPGFAANLKYVTIEMDGSVTQNTETRNILRANGLTRAGTNDSFREVWSKQ